MCKRQLSFGFTLVEVMIVVAIVAILSTIAIPSYASHVQKTRLMQAKAYLNEIRQEAAKLRLTTKDGKYPIDKDDLEKYYSAYKHAEYNHYFEFEFQDEGKTLITKPKGKEKGGGNNYDGFVTVDMVTGKFTYTCVKYKSACKTLEQTDTKNKKAS